VRRSGEECGGTMDAPFSLGSADNKGILSLLSAIEQTGDTCCAPGEEGGLQGIDIRSHTRTLYPNQLF